MAHGRGRQVETFGDESLTPLSPKNSAALQRTGSPDLPYWTSSPSSLSRNSSGRAQDSTGYLV